MMRKALFSLVSVLLLVATACGGAATPGSPTAQPANTSAPSNTAVAATAAPAATPGSTTAAANAGAPQKGGDLVVAYKDDLATLDPAIGYDWTNWPAEKLIFDGLLDYDNGTTLMPRLAESMPTVNSDATVYTFKLRKGVKFSNGREFTADDVIYSLKRVLDPKTASPG